MSNTALTVLMALELLQGERRKRLSIVSVMALSQAPAHDLHGNSTTPRSTFSSKRPTDLLSLTTQSFTKIDGFTLSLPLATVNCVSSTLAPID